MEILVDSGSTKTEWLINDGGVEVQRTLTNGINPAIMSEQAIASIIRDEFVSKLHIDIRLIENIEFYGAGCNKIYAPVMERLLYDSFPHSRVIVDSDIIGAAKAVYDNELCIAAILGTGSNTCLYDGSKIIMQIPPLGYVLGDEGSGAKLGIMLLNGILKKRLPSIIEKEFTDRYKFTLPELLDIVYKKPNPNRFLASLSVFIYEHLFIPEIEELVIDNFTSFFKNNIKPYNHPELSVGFVGSIAYYYKEQLLKAAEKEGIKVSIIKKSPL